MLCFVEATTNLALREGTSPAGNSSAAQMHSVVGCVNIVVAVSAIRTGPIAVSVIYAPRTAKTCSALAHTVMLTRASMGMNQNIRRMNYRTSCSQRDHHNEITNVCN